MPSFLFFSNFRRHPLIQIIELFLARLHLLVIRRPSTFLVPIHSAHPIYPSTVGYTLLSVVYLRVYLALKDNPRRLDSIEVW